MSELIPRRTIRPGLKGYSPEPTDPLEAKDILNLEMDREGIWKPRAGLSTIATFAANINHLSTRPQVTDGYQFAMLEGGRLRVVSITGTSPAVKDTGWPTTYAVRHCFGTTSANANYWCAPKCDIKSAGAVPYRIAAAGGFSALAGSPPNCFWLESYGRYTIALDEFKIYWSDANDSDAWTASSNISRMPNLDRLYGFVAMSEQQAIIISKRGTGIWTGNEESVFQQGELFNIEVAATALTMAKCGERVLFIGPGPRVYSFHPSLERIDSPVNKDLRAIADIDNVFTWFDVAKNWYCVADFDADQTLCYDIEKNIWACRWDKALVGIGQHDDDASPFRRRFFGYGTKFVEMEPDEEQDDGSGMTVAIETAPEDGGNPSVLKCVSGVFVDGTGSWTVTINGRSNPSAAFGTLATMTVSAPGWGYPSYHQYSEMTIRCSAVPTTTTSHSFRQLQVDERILGVIY